VSERITLTFAGDESGDVSFSFGKGASRYFVMAMIATSEAEHLRSLLARLRDEAGLPETYEFGFHALSSARLRERVFDALSKAPFEAWAVIVDKTILPDPFRLFMTGLEVYLYFASELIREIPGDKRQGATLIMDEFGDPGKTRGELKRVMKERGIQHGFRRISVRRSKSEPLIQVADLIAGSILRRDTHNESGAFERIAGKMVRIIEYVG
jgi:hypothetical protein